MINKKINKKKNTNNILLNTLFQSKNFYGESLNQLNKSMLPFIYGKRYNFSIINLKYTSTFLKRIFKLIQYTLKKKKKILIVANSDDIKFLINKNFTKNNSNVILFNEEWVYGLITNNKINNKNNISSFLKNNEIQLIFIIKSSINENYLNTELFSLKIPIISFLNTNQNLKNIHYPLLINTTNIKSLYSLMFLIRQLF